MGIAWACEGSGGGDAEFNNERVSTQSVLEASVRDASAVLHRIRV